MTQAKYKCVVIVIDGLGDLPVPELDNRTPLEAAHTPSLDRLASAGSYGLVDPIIAGVTANTHSGTGMLFGITPTDADKLRRGPVEAAGAGRVLNAGDVALRLNFATVKSAFGGFVVSDRRAGRISEGTHELAEAIGQMDLGDGVTAQLHATDQHRGVLVLSGEGLDDRVSDTDPGDGELPAPVLRCQALNSAARLTADKLNLFIKQSHEILQEHPINTSRRLAGKPLANGALTRGAGQQVAIENIVQQMGVNAAVISACNTVRGLGRMFGFEIISDSRFTGDLDTDIEAKFSTALDAFQQHDLVFIHVKAPDICSHDRRPTDKRDFLERFDLALDVLLQENIVIALTADHTTDSNTGVHTSDPVPSLFFSPDHGPGILGVNFGEEACRNGTMERQNANSFLRSALDAMGLTNNRQ
jgi:2,3-bisphosphoglycerate-independent phosphoglycerate mutase